jgi:hypothetical protein
MEMSRATGLMKWFAIPSVVRARRQAAAATALQNGFLNPETPLADAKTLIQTSTISRFEK